MSTTAVIAELLILGLMSLVTVFFAALLCAGKYDLAFLKNIKDYSSILLFAVPIASYLLGIVTYRLPILFFSLIAWVLPRRLLSRLKIWGINVLGWEESWHEYATVIFQHGSANLTKYVEYEISLGRILQTLAITYPVSAAIILTWVFKSTGIKHQALISVLAALGYLAILSVAISQYVISRSLVMKSYDHLKKQSKPLQSDSGRPADRPSGAPEG